jgi:hypothetical protein
MNLSEFEMLGDRRSTERDYPLPPAEQIEGFLMWMVQQG